MHQEKGGLDSLDENSKCSSIGYLGCARISVGFYNNVHDVDAFLSFLEQFNFSDTDKSTSDSSDSLNKSYESLKKPTTTNFQQTQ